MAYATELFHLIYKNIVLSGWCISAIATALSAAVGKSRNTTVLQCIPSHCSTLSVVSLPFEYHLF